jgi:fatty-acid desaturase
MNNLFASNTKGIQLFIITSISISLFSIPFLHLNSQFFILILLGYFLYGCLGIVITFHRLLTHQSYKTYKVVERLFSVLGCFGGTGSPIAWVAIHINHHLKSDKIDDPHSPLYKGLKIFSLNYENEINLNTKWKMRNLITDRFQQFLHRYYFLILMFWGILLFVIGGINLLVSLFLIPAVITAIMSNIVNYVGHKPNWLGSFRTYHLSDQSANNWIWAIPSWGESWHNNHHRFPKRNYFGDSWYQVDISGLIIKLIRIN